jgi:hypothetical protein
MRLQHAFCLSASFREGQLFQTAKASSSGNSYPEKKHGKLHLGELYSDKDCVHGMNEKEIKLQWEDACNQCK